MTVTKKLRIVKSPAGTKYCGKHFNTLCDIDKAGISISGFSFIEEEVARNLEKDNDPNYPAPLFSDAEVKFQIARLECEKEKAVDHLEKLIATLKSTL